ncbi:MAG: PspA/IM30 family protein [Polyangiaceae bacterium]|nr:PspA/IM30 family protein [Polyangiaceae bacterium]
MGLFDRMGRAISSNFNALLDKADDPRRSIEHTLEEMRAQIRAARAEVVRGVAAEKQLRAKVEQLDADVERWASRAELAVRHGDDALAREALQQKQRLAGERDRAEALRAEQRGHALEMKRELERMEGKLDELSARRGALVATAEQARSQGAEGLGARPGGKAFEEFRRMEQQIEGVDAAVQAQREVDEALGLGRGPGGLSQAEVEARFRALEGRGVTPDGEPPRSEVEDELQAIKRRVRVQP